MTTISYTEFNFKLVFDVLVIKRTGSGPTSCIFSIVFFLYTWCQIYHRKFESNHCLFACSIWYTRKNKNHKNVRENQYLSFWMRKSMNRMDIYRDEGFQFFFQTFLEQIAIQRTSIDWQQWDASDLLVLFLKNTGHLYFNTRRLCQKPLLKMISKNYGEIALPSCVSSKIAIILQKTLQKYKYSRLSTLFFFFLSSLFFYWFHRDTLHW